MSVSDDMVMNSGKMMWSIDEVRRGLSRIGRIPECTSERGPWKRVLVMLPSVILLLRVHHVKFNVK